MKLKKRNNNYNRFWSGRIINEKIEEIAPPIISNSPKQHPKIKKYLLKNQEYTDIWSIAENFNDFLEEEPEKENKRNEKPNLKQDIYAELQGFKLKRIHKSGMRTPKEMWQRIRYLSKGLTLDEWSDRVEGSWENMLEYSEKLWENFFIFSFKRYRNFPYNYLQKFWSDSWYGQNWRNWRREEDTITWQTNSRTPWHKHIRLSNDAENLHLIKETDSKKHTFPQVLEKPLGANRFKLKLQINTNVNRHELIKQGSYNAEQVEMSDLNVWQDSANIYLKYIRPWLFRLNFFDKPSFGKFGIKYLGKEQHRKNYQTVPEKNIFDNELYKVSYNLKLIKQLTKVEAALGFGVLERKFGKRNVKLYTTNKGKFEKLLKYERLLNFRQTNQNLIAPYAQNPLNVYNTIPLNKKILRVFILILYGKKYINKTKLVNSILAIAWIFKPALFFRY